MKPFVVTSFASESDEGRIVLYCIVSAAFDPLCLSSILSRVVIGTVERGFVLSWDTRLIGFVLCFVTSVQHIDLTFFSAVCSGNRD